MSEYLKGTWNKEHTPSMLSRSMLYYIQSMGHFYCGQEYCVDRSNYNTMLLVYTINGMGTLRYLDESYTLTKGTVFLIDCMNPHYYATHQEEGFWEFSWIHFNGNKSRNYTTYINSNEGPVHNGYENSIIPALIQKIHQLYKSFDMTSDILASCAITEILTELMVKSCCLSQQNNSCPDIINQGIAYIERNFNQPMTIDEIVEKMGISKYHFTRIFKKNTGYSPYEYLIGIRLNYSKELLKTTDFPIYEIALKSGFDSASHYIKTFKQKEGITPLKFRKYWE